MILWRAIRIGGGLFSTVKLAFFVLKNEGVAGIIWRMNIARKMDFVDHLDLCAKAERTDYNLGYGKWIDNNEKFHNKILSLDVNNEFHPRISILLPVYRVPLNFLKKAIESVELQSYENWELCICDDASNCSNLLKYLEVKSKTDARIKILIRETNGHISAATNDALALATGEYAALLDHDDELHPDALMRVVQAVKNNPGVEIVYSDVDKLDVNNRRHHPYFKSEFNPVLFLAQNMISHLGVYRVSTLRELGGFRLGVEGAQDWDMAWRVVEAKGVDTVVHIPAVLYHWRELEGSTSRDVGEKMYAIKAQVKVIQDHLERSGQRGVATASERVPGMIRVRYELPVPMPLVSIVIPTRDRKDLISLCIESLFKKTSYENFEIIIIDNESVDADALDFLGEIEKLPNVRVFRENIPFNYSVLNNRGVSHALGEYILMLNNDIEFTHADWLTEMMSWATQPGVGCVGAKLWYPNGTLQHGGVVLGLCGGMAGHAHRGISKIDNGYVGRAVVHQNLSAVTGACMLVKRSIYEELGGLDEQFAVAYNDIDFCLRVRVAGYQIVWTPYAEMVHHESATRGTDSNPQKRARLEAEVALMKQRWSGVLKSDPAYSPNLTRLDENFSINIH